MAYPPRGPASGMVPTSIPLPPGMPAMYHPVGVIPIPPQQATVVPAHIVTAPPRPNRAPPKNIPTGPPVTVFVGNITERAPDPMIRHLLTTCGPVISWKRVQGATGKLQAFGFCEYGNPDAACRAIRILHDWNIGDKKLVVKVDAKAKEVLDAYKKQRRKMMPGYKSPPEDAGVNDADDFLDDAMHHEDLMARDRIHAILQDHSKDMMNYVAPEEKKRDFYQRRDYQTGPKESLDDVEMEDGKRDIINREIDKFRETMKIREAEKEEEKKRREKEDDVRPSKKPPSGDTVSSRRDSRERSIQHRRSGRRRSFSRERSWSRDRSRTRSPAHRSSRSHSHRHHGRSRTRTRSRSRGRTPPSRSKDSKSLWKEREIEEEEKERKKAERKARDKEANYQERLRKWESREARMSKEYDKEKLKESKKQEEMEREGKKLKEFLEDYDDDRDDDKFYKGRELERRLTEREREALKDAEDRAREKEEIDELRSQILKEGYNDPNAELQRRIAEKERLTGGQPIINNSQPPIQAAPMYEDDEVILQPTRENGGHYSDDDNIAAPDPIEDDDRRSPSPLPEVIAPPSGMGVPATSLFTPPAPAPVQPVPRPAVVDVPMGVPPPAVVPAPQTVPPPDQPQHHQSSKQRKKLNVHDVFKMDDDDESSAPTKKRKLPPLTAERKKEESRSSEDKRRHIKSLIEKIPTDKAALFDYDIDWDMVDNQLMEKRIRPWVNKKIAEYIGEPEPTLTDFICSKVLAGSNPKAILDDVQMVLDEEAEVFVVKMWRLLIYEILNKKHKAAMAAPATVDGGVEK